MEIRSSSSEIVRLQPLVSKCNKYMICCSGYDLYVYSVKSGDLVHQLRGHKDLITGIQLNPKHPYQVISCSKDKYLKCWDFMDGVLIKNVDFENPLEGYITLPNSDDAIYVIRKKGTAYVVQSKAMMSFSMRHVKHLFSVTHPQMLCLSVQGGFLACIESEVSFSVYCLKNKVLVQHMVSRDKSQLKILQCSEDITCLAVHPIEFCVALGHTDGKISVWTNVLSQSKVVRTFCHWHSLPVRCLKFTSEGSHLLSGGFESTLVVWKYAFYSKSTSDYVPRLGAPISSVSTSLDNSYYVTTHVDNSIKILLGAKSVLQVYQGLIRDYINPEQFSSGFTFDPRTGAFVATGLPGHIQFYSIEKQKNLYNLDVVGQNYFPHGKVQTPERCTRIELIDIDSYSEWLVTVQRWSKQGYSEQCRMKFWHFEEEEQSFTLHTDIDSLHVGGIAQIKFCNACDKKTESFVSVGAKDKKFKLWSLKDNSDIYRESTCWGVESTGYYKDSLCNDADFSDDGTVLAVSFENMVTIWNPINTTLCTGFPHSSRVKSVRFLQGLSSTCLSVSTADEVLLWDVLTSTVVQKFKMSCSCIAVNENGYMAAFGEEKVHILHSSRGEVDTYVLPDFAKGLVNSAKFKSNSSKVADGLPAWSTGCQLFFATPKGMLLTVSDKKAVRDTPNAEEASAKQFADSAIATPLANLLKGQQVTQTERKEIDQRTGLHSSVLVKQMMDTPAQAMPPLVSLCYSFLNSLLLDEPAQNNGLDEQLMEVSNQESELLSDASDDSDVELVLKAEKKVSHKESGKIKMKDSKIRLISFKGISFPD